MSGPIVRVLAVLADFAVRETSSNQWSARCPAHDDRQASLAVSEGKDGRVLLFCHRGCPLGDVLNSLGLAPRDLFAAPPAQRGERWKHCDYRDERGRLVFQVVRIPTADGKRFVQRRPDRCGGWIWDVEGVRRVLYRLPELLAADTFEPVFIVKGEKDADNLARLGFVATTNPGGAGKWRGEYAEVLRGRHVVILPDNDEVGRQHGADVARSLAGVAASVRVVGLPGLAEHGDVSDWLAAGHTAAELQATVQACTKK
jgi:putative DNA primase/helicase